MRSWSLLARACASGALLATPPIAAHAQAQAPGLIPAIEVQGRGHGHGVGMAQDGALAMGKAGADVRRILGQFYPGTSIGKASGAVRVPVFSGNHVTLAFPEGGEVRAANETLAVPPGGSALFFRDGNGTRVKTSNDAPAPPTTTTSTTAPPTTTTTVGDEPSPTSSTLLPRPQNRRGPNPPRPRAAPAQATTTTAPAPPTTASAPPLLTGAISAVPAGDGRIGVVPRNRRYRGTMEVAAVPGGLRFVNQLNVETYLRGMGEVRNPNWPASGLQAQAIAARTYALRAMAAGGELCDSQLCQVYIGSDAEYVAMDRAVSATSGQVLMHGRSLASAVYSANAGGHSATPEEGFGMPGAGYPYLRPAPYLTDNRDEWTITIALSDVARRLNYRGELTAVNVARMGPSGRATSVLLSGSAGDKIVSGLTFDASLGLRSTLFSLKNVMAAKVATLTGGSVLQAPPEEASALAAAPAPPAETTRRSRLGPARAQQPITADGDIGWWPVVGAAMWAAVVAKAIPQWRRTRQGAHYKLS